MFLKLTSFLVLSLFIVCGLQSQTQPAASATNQVMGEVTAINAASGQISIKTDKGEAVAVITAPGTSFRKVPAGAQSMASAVKTDFGGVSVGDRVVAAGQWSTDRSKIDARAVVVMSRSELDEKRRAEQEDWRKRGISGTVASVDSEAKTFTISAGSRKLVVQLGPNAQFHRYAPDSVRFSDARPSSLAEIKPGDQVRVLGNRGADGLSYAAERIISGSFLQFAGTINSINLQAGELVVKDLGTKKNISVRISADSILRRLPSTMAASLAARYRQNGGRGAVGEPGSWRGFRRSRPGARPPSGDAGDGTEDGGRHHAVEHTRVRARPGDCSYAARGCRALADSFAQCDAGHHRAAGIWAPTPRNSRRAPPCGTSSGSSPRAVRDRGSGRDHLATGCE